MRLSDLLSTHTHQVFLINTLGDFHIWRPNRGGSLNIPNLRTNSTACGHRMAHRKWKEMKQQPCTAEPGNMLGSCLLSFHFLLAILRPQAVLICCSWVWLQSLSYRWVGLPYKMFGRSSSVFEGQKCQGWLKLKQTRAEHDIFDRITNMPQSEKCPLAAQLSIKVPSPMTDITIVMAWTYTIWGFAKEWYVVQWLSLNISP